MNLDTIFGPKRFAPLPAGEWRRLRETAQRNAIQHYMLRGMASENRVIEHLTSLRQLSRVTKIPDTARRHGGDVQFVYRKKLYTMEVKTLTLKGEKGTLTVQPTVKIDGRRAYRVTDFDFLGLSVSDGGLLFIRTRDFPCNRNDPTRLACSVSLSREKSFAPFHPSFLTAAK